MTVIPTLSQQLMRRNGNEEASAYVPVTMSLSHKAQEQHMIERAIRDGRNLDRVRAAIAANRLINGLHRDRNTKAYAEAVAMRDVYRDELWKEFENNDGNFCDSFGEYIEKHYRGARATGYRAAKVGKFLEDLSILDAQFEEEFYEQHGLEREVILDGFGNVDTAATREANRIVSRVRYNDMSQICSAYESEQITASQARELMVKSILFPEDEFRKAIREAKGEVNPLTEFEKILDAGFERLGIVVPIRSDTSVQDLVQELRLLVVSLEGGMGDDALRELRSNTVTQVAKKQARFAVHDGYKFIIL